MKKLLSVVLSVLIIAGGFVGVNAIDLQDNTGIIVAQAATKIKINATKKILVKGQTYQLKISGTNKKVKWSTSKKSVATVSSKGKVTAKAKGTATITAKVSGKSYKCKVTVETPKINKTSITLIEKNTYTLKVSGTSQKRTWSTSSKTVATVSSTGVVTAKKPGTATITAKLTSGKKYTCKVTIKETPVDLNKITTKNYNIVDNRGVVSVITNNNPMAISITITVLYYNNKGELIDSKQDTNYCLESKRTCALSVSAPYDNNTYEYLDYASYKVKISAEKSLYKVLGAKNISINVTNSPSAGKLIVEASNIGSQNLFSVKVAAVFFDESGRCIGYDYTYPECENAGTTDYANIYYPDDSDYNPITPASYQVYVNAAYN